jgi:hypothetical protein
MSIEKTIHDLVLLYDKSTITNIKPPNIPKTPLSEAKITDIPHFEQRCSIMAWQIAYIQYSKENHGKTYQSFVSECIGTLNGLKLYQDAFTAAHDILDKELTIAKLIKFQAS